MNSKYDVFRRLPDGRLLWIDRVRELDEAGQVVVALGSRDYCLVYDFRARTVVEVFGPQVATLRHLAA
jgi:hypothetical protein